MGPWILFSKLEWDQWNTQQRAARFSALAPAGGVAAGGAAGGLADAGGAAAGAAINPLALRNPPQVGLPVGQEVNVEMKAGDLGQSTDRSRSRRVSFDQDRNRNRNSGGNQNSNARQQSRSRSRNRGARIAASFDDDFGFDDVDINDRSSAV